MVSSWTLSRTETPTVITCSFDNLFLSQRGQFFVGFLCFSSRNLQFTSTLRRKDRSFPAEELATIRVSFSFIEIFNKAERGRSPGIPFLLSICFVHPALFSSASAFASPQPTDQVFLSWVFSFLLQLEKKQIHGRRLSRPAEPVSMFLFVLPRTFPVCQVFLSFRLSTLGLAPG